MDLAARIEEAQDKGLDGLVEAQFDRARGLRQHSAFGRAGRDQNRMGEGGASQSQTRHDSQKAQEAHWRHLPGSSLRPGAGAFSPWAL